MVDLLNNTAKEGAIHLDEFLKNLVGIFPDLCFLLSNCINNVFRSDPFKFK